MTGYTEVPVATLNTFLAWYLEANYGGGVTATDYAMGVLADGTPPLACPLTKGGFKVPNEEYFYEDYLPINQSGNQRIAIPKGIEYHDGNLPCLMQDYGFLLCALGSIGNVTLPSTVTVADVGDVLQSMTMHHYNGSNHFETYGTQIANYKLEVKAKDWAIQTLALKHYRSKSDIATETNKCAALTKVAFLAPASYNPLCHATTQLQITSGANTYEYLCKNFTLEIKNNMDCDDNDDNIYINNSYRQKPRLKSRDITVDVTFRGNDSSLANLMRNGWATFDGVKIIFATNTPTGWTSKTLTLGSMRLKNDTYNYTEYPEQGFFEYKGQYVPATNASQNITFA